MNSDGDETANANTNGKKKVENKEKVYYIHVLCISHLFIKD